MRGTCGDQPRMRLWPDSMTGFRPRRSSSTRWSTALAIRPMSEPARKMPMRVTTKPRARVDHASSPAKEPASIMRSIFCHSLSTNDSSRPPPKVRLAIVAITAATTITSRLSSAR
jgi:hypothetical protein